VQGAVAGRQVAFEVGGLGGSVVEAAGGFGGEQDGVRGAM
jgi:hypothetical protein